MRRRIERGIFPPLVAATAIFASERLAAQERLPVPSRQRNEALAILPEDKDKKFTPEQIVAGLDSLGVKIIVQDLATPEGRQKVISLIEERMRTTNDDETLALIHFLDVVEMLAVRMIVGHGEKKAVPSAIEEVPHGAPSERVWGAPERINEGVGEQRRFRNIAIAPDGTLFTVSFGSGIFRSHDNGNNWERVSDGRVDFRGGFLFAKDGKIYCNCNQELYCSEDNGQTWVVVWQNPDKDSKNGDRKAGGRMFALTEGTDGVLIAGIGHKTKRSEDGGRTWDGSNFLKNDIVYGFVEGFAHGSEGAIYAAAQRGLFVSLDNGKSWKEMSGYSFSAVAAHPNGTVFAASGGVVLGYRIDQVIAESNEKDSRRKLSVGPLKIGIGGFLQQNSWAEASRADLSTDYITDITIDATTGEIIVTARNGVFMSRDNGQTFSPIATSAQIGGWTWQTAIDGAGDLVTATEGKGIVRMPLVGKK